MARKTLSDKQRAIMLLIEDHIQTRGIPPTNREIGEGLGIESTGHVDYHLGKLEARGYISREKRIARSIRMLVSVRDQEPMEIAPEQTSGIPIMGTIAAGTPIEHHQGHTEVMEMLNPTSYRKGVYALRVRGDSMIEDGIFSGDYVVIEPTQVAHEHEIIVATDTSAGEMGAATLKRFSRKGKEIQLLPANKTMNPIVVDAKDWDRSWRVQGRVVAVVRNYQYN